MRQFFKTTTVAVSVLLAGVASTALIAASASAQEVVEDTPIDPALVEAAKEGNGASLYNLGWAYLDREETSAAAEAFRKAIDAYGDAAGEDLKWKAETFASLAGIHLNTGDAADLELAEDYYLKAVDLYSQTEGEDLGSLRVALYNLGWIYSSKGGAENLDRARTYMKAALDAYAGAQGDDLKWQAALHSAIGHVDMSSARFNDAIQSFDAAGAIWQEIGDPASKAQSLVDKGMALQGLSKYQDAIGFFKEAREILVPAIGEISSQVADTYLNEGISLEGLTDYDAALETYDKALQLYSEALGDDAVQIAWVTNNVAWVQRRLGNFEASKGAFLQAEPIIATLEGRYSFNHSKVAINLGIIEHYLGDQDAAIRWTMDAMPFIQANREITLDDQRWAFDTLARAFRAKGDRTRAIAFAKLAVNAQQSIRSANSALSAGESKELQDEWRWLYQHLADMLIEEGRFTEAQAVLNMEKEQEVFEFLRRDGSADLRDTRAILNDSELGEQEKITAIAAFPLSAAQELDRLVAKFRAGEASDDDKGRMLLLQKSVQLAVNDFNTQVDAFLASVTDQNQEIYKERLDAVGSYQALLETFEDKTAILQVAAIDDATHIFLTLPELTLHRKSDVSKADLSRMTFDALVSIEALDPAANDKLAALYDVLVRPVADTLEEADVRVVMLNLDGFLRYVPFAALYDGKRYFVEDYAVSLYTTSVQTQFKRGDRAANRSAGFGVTAAHPGFSPLPGVKREIETIFAGDDKAGVLEGPVELDEDFSETSLQLTLLLQPSILHIASHFNLIPGREDDSFLLLGDGTHLALSDIRSEQALSFKGIDLVTLSACQTARGGGGDGSEIEGFGATAQLSGASAVMASLWPVADAATARLMGDFYDGMVRQNLSKADALRAAQMRMLSGETVVAAADADDERAAQSKQKHKRSDQAGFSHPYYWSPFILMGNWL